MKVSLLLSELQGNILRDTSHAVRGQGSSNWNPASLVAYLSEAADIMAEETHCIMDASTPEVTEIALEEGVDTYDLHEKVISVYSVRVGHRTTGRRLKSATTSAMEDGSSDVLTDVPRRLIGASDGKPYAFAVDEATGVLRVYPTPGAKQDQEVLYLRVARLPLKAMEVPVDGDPDTDVEPEVPSMRHMALCDWAAYRALRNHDTDVEDIPKASTHRNEWERTIARMRKRWRRMRMVPATFGVRVNN